MKFVSALIALAAVALASPVEVVERQTATPAVRFVTALNQTGAALLTLNKTLTGFVPGNGAIATALKIRSQTGKIADLLQQANDAAKAQNGLFTVDEAGTIAFATIGLINPANSTINTLISKQPVFAVAVFGAGDLSKTVEAGLVQQRQATSDLSAILVPKLPAPFNGAAPAVVAQLLAIFDRGIAAYSKCTGKICLPVIPS